MPNRLTQKRIEDIAPSLTVRDKEILLVIRRCRYLTTQHIRRLYFSDSATASAGLRAASRHLDKLKGHGLLDTLTRRIGGARAGSGSFIWHLTQGGERMLRFLTDSACPHRYSFEPSTHFVRHMLAVAECFVQITEIYAGNNPALIDTDLEPDCWRSYSDKGHQTSLRPDLFAVTVCGEYEDRWFIEVDLNTESPSAVMEKCRRYHDYYRSGLEQKQHGVFPLAVWIVPDEARKESLVSHIREEFCKQPKIFIVITPDELEPLLQQGVSGGVLC